MANNEHRQTNGESQQVIYEGHANIKQEQNALYLHAPRKNPGFQMMSVRIPGENALFFFSVFS